MLLNLGKRNNKHKKAQKGSNSIKDVPPTYTLLNYYKNDTQAMVDMLAVIQEVSK